MSVCVCQYTPKWNVSVPLLGKVAVVPATALIGPRFHRKETCVSVDAGVLGGGNSAEVECEEVECVAPR